MYGTARDPEYLPFARSAALTAAFVFQGLLAPLLLLARFLLLAPIGLFSSRVHHWLVECGSALTINLQ